MAHKRPPIVGVPCIAIQSAKKHRPPRLGQNRTYLDALVRAGAAPVLIPHLTDESRLRALYDSLVGLLLPGGEDVDPARYGEARQTVCGASSDERDGTELALARWAVAEGKPLLAICRGIQVLNVSLGGSLYQDIKAQVPGADKHNWYPGYPRDRLSHPVSIVPQTRLARIVSAGSLAVNSLHHQAIKEAAPGLIVSAHAPDQIVEAAEVDGHPFAVAVQWHPEELAPDDTQAQLLFDAFVEACQG